MRIPIFILVLLNLLSCASPMFLIPRKYRQNNGIYITQVSESRLGQKAGAQFFLINDSQVNYSTEIKCSFIQAQHKIYGYKIIRIEKNTWRNLLVISESSMRRPYKARCWISNIEPSARAGYEILKSEHGR